ncbi:MAG: hypothetical protein LBQ15_11595 [Clostridium sp.]|nr:hypothetical protein [Clostridium sp.]
MDLTTFYSEIGVDIKTVVNRLGLPEKYLKKYLRKFKENKEYQKLSKAVAEQDDYNVEWAAHSLKGVASNLGLNSLLTGFQDLVDSVRHEDTQRIPELFEATSQEYQKIMSLLEEVDLEES